MRTGPHPLRFFIVVLPYGAAFGYATVALQWVATQVEHVPAEDFTKVTALAYFAHSIKLGWAPIVDTTLSARRWYLIGLVLTFAGILASSLVPLTSEGIGTLAAVVMASQIGLTLIGFSVEQMLASLPREEKGTASGFYQGGNYLGLGLGGGLALSLSEVFSARWMTAAVLCAMLAPSALALIGMPSPPREERAVLDALKATVRDLRDVLAEKIDGRWRAWLPGLLALFICLSPIGTGAASTLFPSIASHWGASATSVARVNGWLGGVVGMLGCLAGGWLADRTRRRNAYAIGGALTALSGILFALGPREPWAYAAGVIVYTFFNGIALAGFTALVLETIGPGTAATKYNIFAAVANSAIAYMARVDGTAYGKGHESRMLFTDAAATFGGIALLFAVIVVFDRITAHRERRMPAPV